MRLTPASTVATWRSLRSKGRARWAKFQASAESRRSMVAFRVGERPELEALAGAPAQIVAPVGGVGAVGVLGRRRAGVGPGGLDQRLEF